MFKYVATALTLCVLTLNVHADDGENKGKKRDGKKADPAAMFKKLDTDSDDKLSKEEFAKFGANAKKAGKVDPAKIFDKLDTDQDGFISMDEWKQLRDVMAKGKDKKKQKKGDS